MRRQVCCTSASRRASAKSEALTPRNSDTATVAAYIISKAQREAQNGDNYAEIITRHHPQAAPVATYGRIYSNKNLVISAIS